MGVRSCLDPFPSSVWAGRQGASAVWEGRVIQNCLQGLAPDLLKKCSDCQSGPLGLRPFGLSPVVHRRGDARRLREGS